MMAEPEIDAPSATSERRIRVAFTLLALLSMLSGAAIHVFSTRLGIEAQTSRSVATAFIAAGILDALVLYFWERLFGVRKDHR